MLILRWFLPTLPPLRRPLASSLGAPLTTPRSTLGIITNSDDVALTLTARMNS